MMHRLFTVFLLAACVAACNNDTEFDDLDPDEMRYDGANSSAPNLPAGTAEAMIKFDGQTLDFYQGKKIDAVQYYIYEVPQSVEMVLYGEGTGDDPGAVLYEQVITQDLQENSWNTIPLLTPMEVPADEIWIGLRMTLNSVLQVIGCDSGPAQEGGDWLYQSTDNEWLTFRGRGGPSINWNIRAQVSE